MQTNPHRQKVPVTEVEEQNKVDARLEFIQTMITKLRLFLISSDPVISLSIDGMSATYDRNGAWDMLQKLEQEERQILNPRRMMRRVDMRGAFD